MLILALFAVLAMIFLLCFRTWRFRPPKAATVSSSEIPIDTATAVTHLQGMLRCRTVSAPELRDETEFVKFRALLPE